LLGSLIVTVLHAATQWEIRVRLAVVVLDWNYARSSRIEQKHAPLPFNAFTKSNSKMPRTWSRLTGRITARYCQCS
jgi:hypothetical protein